MEMFTTQEKKNLTKLLSCAVNQDDVFSLDALHGFMFGLAIIPEHIIPSEWLFSIFGEEMLEINNEEEGDRLFGSLFGVLNRMTVANDKDELTFPFDFDSIKTKDIQRIREWANGLFLATNLRPEIWGMNDDDEFVDDEVIEDELYEDEQYDDDLFDEDVEEITACFAILMGVAFPDRIPEIFDNASNSPDALDRNDPELETKLFAMLPDVVVTLKKYANEVRDGTEVLKADNYPEPPQPLRMEKIGRNDPCPCGSGKKYKQCCGK